MQIAASVSAWLLATFGILVLLFLPGAWITFGLRLSNPGFAARLLSGVMIAPFVVCVQFYVLRLAGASFHQSVIALVLVNLPAAALVFRRTGKIVLPSNSTIAKALLVVAIPLAFIAIRAYDPQIRMYYGHAWMHNDIVYRLASGELRPEDAQLAGLRLDYPWTGLVYQGVLSYLLSSPLASNYLLLSVIWLLCIFGLVSLSAKELGGNCLSRISSPLWLCFAVNPVGYVLQRSLPTQLAERYFLWGDWRVTPWLRKFFTSEQIVFGLGLFAVLLLFLLRPWPRGRSVQLFLFVSIILTGLVWVYPLLFPAAAALVAARALAPAIAAGSLRRPSYQEPAALGAAILVAAASAFWYLGIVTVDRVGGDSIELKNNLPSIVLAAARTVVTLSPLLLALLLVLPRLWRTHRSALIVCVGGTAGSALLYAFLHIPNYTNEYKYLLTAAICLAALPGIALEPLADRLGRMAFTVWVGIGLVLAAPAAHKMYYNWPNGPQDQPRVEAQGFDLRLAKGERFARICDAIRERTPPRTIIVTDKADFGFQTVTRRQLYVPYRDAFVPGIGLDNDYLLKAVKGYDHDLVEERRAQLRGLFEPADDATRERSLAGIQALGRPVAIILDEQRHQPLLQWLLERKSARPLFRGDGLALVVL